MKRFDQRGHVNGLLIPLIVVTVLLFVAAGMGIWAFIGRQDYKNNTDQKIAAAVVVAEQQTSTKKDSEFIEKEKQPYISYQGPAPYGSLKIVYPKTWSAYVNEKATNSAPVDAYFHPGFVPAVADTSVYALRVQIDDKPYAETVKTYDTNVKQGKVRASAYIPASAPDVTGIRFDGEIFNKKQGSMIVVPLRDKSLKIWAESPDFVKDLDSIILPNYTFAQ